MCHAAYRALNTAQDVTLSSKPSTAPCSVCIDLQHGHVLHDKVKPVHTPLHACNALQRTHLLCPGLHQCTYTVTDIILVAAYLIRSTAAGWRELQPCFLEQGALCSLCMSGPSAKSVFGVAVGSMTVVMLPTKPFSRLTEPSVMRRVSSTADGSCW